MSNPYLEAALRQQGTYVPTDYGQELLNAIKANPDAFRGRGLMNWRSSDGLGIMDIPAEARAIGDAYLGSDEYRSTVTQPTPQAPPRGANTAPAPTPAPSPKTVVPNSGNTSMTTDELLDQKYIKSLEQKEKDGRPLLPQERRRLSEWREQQKENATNSTDLDSLDVDLNYELPTNLNESDFKAYADEIGFQEGDTPQLGDLLVTPDKVEEVLEQAANQPPPSSDIVLPDGSTVNLGLDYTNISPDFINNLPEINTEPTEPINEADFISNAVGNEPFVPSGIDDISEISIDNPLGGPVGGFDSYEDYMTNLNNLGTEDFENYADEMGFQEGDTPELGDLVLTPEKIEEIEEQAANQPPPSNTVTLPDGRVVELPTYQGEGSPYNEDGTWKTDLPEGFDINNMEAPNPNVPQGVLNVGSIDPAIYDNVYQPSAVDPSIYEDAIFDQQILDMPEIMDYSEMMRAPLIDRVMGALDSPNPYDTRRDAMMKGPTGQIQRNWEQANEDLMNRFGVMGMDTPALYAQARKLDEAKALQMDNLESQWAGMAAGQDEGLRRNRLSDATQMMGNEYGRVRDEMAFQGGLQDKANAGVQNFMAGSQAGMGDALSYDDSGLNMASGAGGGYVAPNVGAAATGLAQIANQAGQNIKNQPDWSGAATGLYKAFNQPQQPAQLKPTPNPNPPQNNLGGWDYTKPKNGRPNTPYS